MKEAIARMLLDKLDNKRVRAVQIMFMLSSEGGKEETKGEEGLCSHCAKDQCECEGAEHKEEEED